MRGMLVAGRALGVAVGAWLGVLLLPVPAALAAGPATNVVVSLSPPVIAANGSSTTTATATVTDSGVNPVAGDAVTFTSDGGQAIGATTDHGDGTYTTAITSTSTPGHSTITATDTSVTPGVNGTAGLTQFGPAAQLALSLTPSSIPADGASTSTATATITDAGGNPVVGDAINFTSDGGQAIGATTDHVDGTYTATITSTARAGQSTITATDASAPGVSDEAPLTQTRGAATTVRLSLFSSSIVADGASTTVATATVTDAKGNAVIGDSVVISTSTGQSVAAADRGDGTYGAQIHSTTTPGPVTVTATDQTAGVSGQASLTQTAGVSGQAPLTQNAVASTTSLGASPASPVTNQVVTLVARVSTAGNPAPMSGSVTFANFGAAIGGSCSDKPVSSAKPTVTCRVSFSADASPEQLTATFTPDANSAVSGSAGALTLPISGDSTSTSVTSSNRAPAIRRSTRYTAVVRSRHSGFAQPTGSVQFLDGTKAISKCSRKPLRVSGSSLAATCSVSYRSPGRHKIVARYLGSRDFRTSSSSAVKVRALRAVTSSLRSNFKSTRAYTSVLALSVTGVPAGSKVVTTCHGRGCPFATQTTAIKTSRQGRTIDLSTPFGNRRLSVNARVVVEIVRTNWIGKYYGFVVRSGRRPSARVSCLAPGSSKPGVGCQA